MFIKNTISNSLSIRVLKNPKSALLKTFKLPGRSCCRVNGPHLKGFIKGRKKITFFRYFKFLYTHSLNQVSKKQRFTYVCKNPVIDGLSLV